MFGRPIESVGGLSRVAFKVGEDRLPGVEHLVGDIVVGELGFDVFLDPLVITPLQFEGGCLATAVELQRAPQRQVMARPPAGLDRIG